jgi:hypothetical protein
MKKQNIVLALFFFLSLSFLAQENYTIKMAMRMEGLSPEMAAMGDMEITNYVKGDKIKSETVGMMGTRTMLIDGEKLTALNDRMGNKTGYTATRAELDEADKNSKNLKTKFDYTSEKKTIAGYECTKVLVTNVREKEESVAVFWVTDKINLKNNRMMRAQGGKDALDLSELKGYPLSMEIDQQFNGQNLKMILTATSVSIGPLEDKLFTVNTEGYNMISYKEMLSRQSAQMGPR